MLRVAGRLTEEFLKTPFRPGVTGVLAERENDIRQEWQNSKL